MSKEVVLIDRNELLKHEVMIITKGNAAFHGVPSSLIEIAPVIGLKSLRPKARLKMSYSFLGDENYTCTNCGEILVLEEGTPEENEYKFCPFCGAEIEGVDREEDEAEDG